MKNGQMKIEKGIPLPESWGRGLRSVASETLSAMKPGDSVLVETVKEARRMYASGRFLKIKVATRAEGAGFRVWRVK